MRLDTLAPGQCAEIDVRQLRAGQLSKPEMRGEFVERVVAAVLHDHECDGQTEFRDRSEALYRIHARTVAEQRNDFPRGSRESNADGRRQTVPETAARAREKRIGLDDWQVVVHRTATTRRLLDDDAADGPQRRNPLQQVPVRQLPGRQ